MLETAVDTQGTEEETGNLRNHIYTNSTRYSRLKKSRIIYQFLNNNNKTVKK